MDNSHESCTKIAVLERANDVLEKRVNNHSERIDLLERTSSARDKEIANLIQQLKETTSTMRWFIGVFFVSYMGFFIWFVQQGVRR